MDVYNSKKCNFGFFCFWCRKKQTLGATTFHQLTVLSTFHFKNLLSSCHLINWHFCQLDMSRIWSFIISSIGIFVKLQFHQFAFKSPCHFINLHFVNLQFHQFAISSSCHFINWPFCQLAVSSICHLITLSFHQLAILSTCWVTNLPFHHPVISSIGLLST
jgi:hypothetical protein